VWTPNRITAATAAAAAAAVGKLDDGRAKSGRNFP